MNIFVMEKLAQIFNPIVTLIPSAGQLATSQLHVSYLG